MNDAEALWHVAPRRAEIRPAALGDGAVVRTEASMISRGTERLVFEGRVPASEQARMRCPHQAGDFPFPVKYGYAAVGVVEAGPAELVGDRVFALHPHQTRFSIPAADLVPVPGGLTPQRACLAANMETALNALWDAGAGPGDRIAVIGGGLVGCLVARLAARLPGAEVTLVDKIEARSIVAPQLNVSFMSDGAPEGCDIAFHASASGPGLQTAIDCLGPEGRLVELSWYGDGEVSLALGGGFHSQRLSLISSQVGMVAPSRRPRWPYRRRLAKALELLHDPAIDALIATRVAFRNLPDRLPELLAPDAPGIATIIDYD